jgi:hypothetical protein
MRSRITALTLFIPLAVSVSIGVSEGSVARERIGITSADIAGAIARREPERKCKAGNGKAAGVMLARRR